jgi:hypothetical protein
MMMIQSQCHFCLLQCSASALLSGQILDGGAAGAFQGAPIVTASGTARVAVGLGVCYYYVCMIAPFTDQWMQRKRRNAVMIARPGASATLVQALVVVSMVVPLFKLYYRFKAASNFEVPVPHCQCRLRLPLTSSN